MVIQNKKKKIVSILKIKRKLGKQESVWYICLKTENGCLKIFIEIRASEKVYENA